jgi:hypothetical protein
VARWAKFRQAELCANVVETTKRIIAREANGKPLVPLWLGVTQGSIGRYGRALGKARPGRKRRRPEPRPMNEDAQSWAILLHEGCKGLTLAPFDCEENLVLMRSAVLLSPEGGTGTIVLL